jgi:subtilisin family serine protease
MIKTSPLLLLLVSVSALAAIPKKFPVLKEKTLVAVIDTGVDIHHPQLKKYLWRNSGEIPNNGIDDDGNGFIDDVNGWNFLENNNRVNDPHGHGTHIAGIIAGEDAQLMVIRAMDPKLSGPEVLQATVEAIRYAVLMHAKIINYSGGGIQASLLERQAIEAAERKGTLFVAAAGNGYTNSDIHGFFPADYGLSNIISVAAVDQKGLLLPSSNFGTKTVTLAARGKEIHSTLPHNHYGKMSGTSQATAVVTRLLTKLVRKSSSPLVALIRSGKKQAGLVGKVKNPVIVSEENSP